MSQIRNNIQPTRGSYKPRNNRYRNSPNNRPRRRPRSFKTTQGEGWTKVSGNNNMNHSRRQQSQYQASPKTSQFNTANKFAALGEDDENDECLSSKSHRVEEVPTVIRTATVLKGAWGKGVSAAVKEEKTFEKQIVVEKINEIKIHKKPYLLLLILKDGIGEIELIQTATLNPKDGAMITSNQSFKTNYITIYL